MERQRENPEALLERLKQEFAATMLGEEDVRGYIRTTLAGHGLLPTDDELRQYTIEPYMWPHVIDNHQQFGLCVVPPASVTVQRGRLGVCSEYIYIPVGYMNYAQQAYIPHPSLTGYYQEQSLPIPQAMKKSGQVITTWLLTTDRLQTGFKSYGGLYAHPQRWTFYLPNNMK